MENNEIKRPEPIKVVKCKTCLLKRECLNMGWFWPHDNEPITLYLCPACARNFVGLDDDE